MRGAAEGGRVEWGGRTVGLTGGGEHRGREPGRRWDGGGGMEELGARQMIGGRKGVWFVEGKEEGGVVCCVEE